MAIPSNGGRAETVYRVRARIALSEAHRPT